MSDTKAYSYQGTIITLQYYPSTPYSDSGWHWKCFRGGHKIADSLKQYCFAETSEALVHAKDEIDFLLDIDSADTPIFVGEP